MAVTYILNSILKPIRCALILYLTDWKLDWNAVLFLVVLYYGIRSPLSSLLCFITVLHTGWSGLKIWRLRPKIFKVSLLVSDALALVEPTGPTVGFLLLQHFSYFLPSSPHRCFISGFVWFFGSRRCCTDELGTLHTDWTNVLCIPRQK